MAGIERAEKNDLPAISAIDTAARFTEQELLDELSRPHAVVWILREHDGEPPVAFVVAWVVADELHILNVATAETHRRRGHGRRLMRWAIEQGRAAGITAAFLEVRRRNVAAIGLYRTLGFYALGIRPRYYKDGEDALLMALRLSHETGEAIPCKDEVT